MIDLRLPSGPPAAHAHFPPLSRLPSLPSLSPALSLALCPPGGAARRAGRRWRRPACAGLVLLALVGTLVHAVPGVRGSAGSSHPPRPRAGTVARALQVSCNQPCNCFSWHDANPMRARTAPSRHHDVLTRPTSRQNHSGAPAHGCRVVPTSSGPTYLAKKAAVQAQPARPACLLCQPN
eukprot:scaffold60999_cov60-Phaeocystis_antarctica.AAC.1